MKNIISILFVSAVLFLGLTSPFWITDLLIRDSKLLGWIFGVIFFLLILCLVSLSFYLPEIIKKCVNTSGGHQEEKDPKIGIKIDFSFGCPKDSNEDSSNKKEKEDDREFLRALKVLYNRIFKELDDVLKK